MYIIYTLKYVSEHLQSIVIKIMHKYAICGCSMYVVVTDYLLNHVLDKKDTMKNKHHKLQTETCPNSAIIVNQEV